MSVIQLVELLFFVLLVLSSVVRILATFNHADVSINRCKGINYAVLLLFCIAVKQVEFNPTFVSRPNSQYRPFVFQLFLQSILLFYQSIPKALVPAFSPYTLFNFFSKIHDARIMTIWHSVHLILIVHPCKDRFTNTNLWQRSAFLFDNMLNIMFRLFLFTYI